MACRTAVTLLLTASFFQMALCQDMWKRGLQCYSCGFDEPCGEKIVTCKDGERCGTVEGHLDYKVHDSIFKKDCVSAQKCDSQDKISYLGRPYRVTYKCCNANFCNTGTSEAPRSSATHLPLLLTIPVLAILFTFLS